MTLTTTKTNDVGGPPPPLYCLRDDSSCSSLSRTGTHRHTPSSSFYCPQSLLRLPPRRVWWCWVDQCHSNPACPKPWSHSSAGGNSLFRKLRLLLNLLLLPVVVLPTRQRQQQQPIVPARRLGRARRRKSSRSSNGSDGTSTTVRASHRYYYQSAIFPLHKYIHDSFCFISRSIIKVASMTSYDDVATSTNLCWTSGVPA